MAVREFAAGVLLAPFYAAGWVAAVTVVLALVVWGAVLVGWRDCRSMAGR